MVKISFTQRGEYGNARGVKYELIKPTIKEIIELRQAYNKGNNILDAQK